MDHENHEALFNEVAARGDRITELEARLAAAEQQIADLDQFVTAALEDRDYFEAEMRAAEQERDLYRRSHDERTGLMCEIASIIDAPDAADGSVDFAALPKAVEVVKQERDRLREERDEARAVVKVAHAKDVWFWQGKADYPESLTCPVVMSADTLRAMLAETDRLRSEVKQLIADHKYVLAEHDKIQAEADRLREALGAKADRISAPYRKEIDRLRERVRELTGALDAAAKSLMAVRHWDRDDKEQPGTGPRLYAENRARVARAVLESALPPSPAPEAPSAMTALEQERDRLREALGASESRVRELTGALEKINRLSCEAAGTGCNAEQALEYGISLAKIEGVSRRALALPPSPAPESCPKCDRVRCRCADDGEPAPEAPPESECAKCARYIESVNTCTATRCDWPAAIRAAPEATEKEET